MRCFDPGLWLHCWWGFVKFVDCRSEVLPHLNMSHWAFDCLIEKLGHRAIERLVTPFKQAQTLSTHTSIFIVQPPPSPIHRRHNSGKVINLQYWGFSPPLPILDLPLMLFIPLIPFGILLHVQSLCIIIISLLNSTLSCIICWLSAAVDYRRAGNPVGGQKEFYCKRISNSARGWWHDSRGKYKIHQI